MNVIWLDVHHYFPVEILKDQESPQLSPVLNWWIWQSNSSGWEDPISSNFLWFVGKCTAHCTFEFWILQPVSLSSLPPFILNTRQKPWFSRGWHHIFGRLWGMNHLLILRRVVHGVAVLDNRLLQNHIFWANLGDKYREFPSFSVSIRIVPSPYLHKPKNWNCSF